MRSIRTLAAVAFAVAGALGASTASAHHSFAPHFDIKKPVSISGKVTEFEARNPHSYLHVQAVDENGRTEEYICESHGFTQLKRNGLSSDMLKPTNNRWLVSMSDCTTPARALYSSPCAS